MRELRVKTLTGRLTNAKMEASLTMRACQGGSPLLSGLERFPKMKKGLPAPRDCENCLLACGGVADEVFFPSKTVIFEPEEPASKSFLLLSGLVEISVKADDKRVVLFVLRPGLVFGWSGLFCDEKYGFRTVAMRDSYACALSAELVRDTLRDRPAAVTSILGMVCHTLRDGARLAAIRAHPSVGTRLDRLLTFLGERTESVAPGGDRVLSFTHEELADMIGSTRPTVTRQLQLLRRKGVVTLKKKQIVLNP